MSDLYGRRFELRIVCNPKANQDKLDVIYIEQNSFSPESLRIIFDINYPGYSGWYFSEIVIYNLSPEFRKKVIEEGAICTLKAGYIGSEENFGVIFQGYVFQTLFEREGVVDYKLTLRCMDGDKLFMNKNFISTTLKAGMDFVTRINEIVSRSQNKIPTGELAEYLDYQKKYRGETMFKTPAEAFRETYGFRGVTKEADYRMMSFQSQVCVIDENTPFDAKPTVIVSPTKGGLIGTPVQTMYGCNFVTLLNPNIVLRRPHCVVKLDNVSFQQMKIEYGSLPASGIEVSQNETTQDYQIQEYQVIGVRHVGDSRGEKWYTYVTGMNMKGAKPVEPWSYQQG